jgi:hypothetical protein
MATKKKCYYADYINCFGQSGNGYFCSEAMVYEPIGGTCGGGAYVSRDNGLNQSNASVRSGSLTEVGLSNCPNCLGIRPDEPYDCINGTCLPARTYNTPGRFPNAGACGAGCLPDSSCKGKCIGADEIRSLQQRTQELRSRFC